MPKGSKIKKAKKEKKLSTNAPVSGQINDSTDTQGAPTPSLELSASNKSLNTKGSDSQTPTKDEREEGEHTPSPPLTVRAAKIKQTQQWVQTLPDSKQLISPQPNTNIAPPASVAKANVETQSMDAKSAYSGELRQANISFPEADPFPNLSLDVSARAFDFSLSHRQQQLKVDRLIELLPTSEDWKQRGQPGAKFANTWKWAYGALTAVMPPLQHPEGPAYAVQAVQHAFYNVLDRFGFTTFRNMLFEALTVFHVEGRSLQHSFDRFIRLYAEGQRKVLESCRLDFPKDCNTINTINAGHFNILPDTYTSALPEAMAVKEVGNIPNTPLPLTSAQNTSASLNTVKPPNTSAPLNTATSPPATSLHSQQGTSTTSTPTGQAVLSVVGDQEVIVLPRGTGKAKATELLALVNTMLRF